jgi:hypothetical protein
MSLTNEQIDAAIAALEAQRVKPPREMWIVLDRDGDSYVHDSAYEGQRQFEELSSDSVFAPCTLHHMREVLP